ncbi:hypothetical protein [Photobacterium alginatilyticum]|uniref:DUF3426 domain-containing protein n=1 Tax=Photobacterium alginatilyticum TaxID=1775171 RepID=A0ABW9YQ11_9GAMM|nr:hypothetical protein [Photobacterium alginatilyticum]NBI55480.1 hypothetical protein [Photobacterium alginatilyticum]
MFESFIPSPNVVVGSVIAALIVAGIMAYINRRALFVIVPRSFSYSDLSAGQIVELTIINKGNKSEENVEVQLQSKLRYTLIASTLPSLDLSQDCMISLHRLPKGEDVSVILSVEEGEFSQDCVLSVSSKETKGKVKNNIEESQQTSSLEVAFFLVLIFVGMPVFGYFGGNLFVQDILPRLSSSTKAEVETVARLENQGWEKINKFVKAVGSDMNASEWPITISFPKRNGDLLSFTVNIKNRLPERAQYNVSLTSTYDQNKYILSHSILPNLRGEYLLLPNQDTSEKLEIYLPYEAKKKIVVFEFFVKDLNGIYTFNYVWEYDGKQ